MKINWGGYCACLAGICLACVDYTPKPRGYVRIEPAVAVYQLCDLPELPFLFEVSQVAKVELPEEQQVPSMVNLSYPSLHAKIYCS